MRGRNADRENTSPAGQVRVLVIGDVGVGKTSLVHLLVNGQPISKPKHTVGCAVSVKFVEYEGAPGNNINSSQPSRGYFIELWDVSGNDLYKGSRPLFYNQINGVIFVHDLSHRKSRSSLKLWTSELLKWGSFSAPSSPCMDGSLPVPLLVIGNKADIPEKDPLVKGKFKLIDAASRSKTLEAARSWAGKHRLLSLPNDLPLHVHDSVGLVSAVREGRLDTAAVSNFFSQLITRRYFTEVVPFNVPPPKVFPWRDSDSPLHSSSASIGAEHDAISVVESSESPRKSTESHVSHGTELHVNVVDETIVLPTADCFREYGGQELPLLVHAQSPQALPSSSSSPKQPNVTGPYSIR